MVRNLANFDKFFIAGGVAVNLKWQTYKHAHAHAHTRQTKDKRAVLRGSKELVHSDYSTICAATYIDDLIHKTNSIDS